LVGFRKLMRDIAFPIHSYYAPATNRRGHKAMMLSDVCLTCVAYIGPKSRTERLRKTKIGTEVAHATRDSSTTFKVKRSKVEVTRPLYSTPCWRFRQLQRWAWERVGRRKLLPCCRLLGGARRFGAHGEEKGQGISCRPPTACFASLLVRYENAVVSHSLKTSRKVICDIADLKH